MGFCDTDIKNVKKSKRLKNGGFEKKLFLEEVLHGHNND